MQNKVRSLLFVLALTSVASNLFSRDIGGYVANAEDRFQRNVWNFLKEFQSTQYPGGVPWKYTQYYWAAPYEFTTSNNSYVDYVDFAYVSGHGSANYFQTQQSPNVAVYFPTQMPTNNGWGDWDGEFITFQSCAVVPSPIEQSNWWSNWGRCLKGVHQIIGYRTNSYSDNGISNNYARKLKANHCVMYAWFDAVNEERSWWYGSDYPGYACALYYGTTQYDRLSSSEYPDPYGYSNLWCWYQY